MKTYMAKPEELERKWVLIDAADQVLGRVATKAAIILRGKHKAGYTPHVDCGDGVIVINASKIRVTGNKYQDKIYMRYSGYPGGLKKENFAHLFERKPTEVVIKAVKGMLQKNSLGYSHLKHLRVYAGSEHEQQAQEPKAITV